VFDQANCVDTPAWTIKYMHVTAQLLLEGAPVGDQGEDECGSGPVLYDCANVTAQSPTIAPFCCVPAGVQMGNQGTWVVVLGEGLEWDELPGFCDGEGTDTATCERVGRYTSGNAADVASAGADVALALFSPVGD
jgi:hypothetical protein